MRWKRGTQNDDVIDDRGAGGGGGGLGGGTSMGGLPFPIPMGKKGGIGGGTLLVLAVVFILTRVLGGGGGGFDIGNAVNQVPQAAGSGPATPLTGVDPEADQVDFIRFVLKDVQDFWTDSFATGDPAYSRARLVLFRQAVNTGCGRASSDVGPFYCPVDRRVYIDIGFMEQLQRQFKAQGDFAEAYIIAHEIGHHVQNQLGIAAQVDQELQKNPDEKNELSVRQELQADCFAGVWAHSAIARGLTEAGDVDEALNAAAAVGDDRIQAQVRGRISPETFTHGTAEQRSRWLKRGMDSGDIKDCDTFGASSL